MIGISIKQSRNALVLLAFFCLLTITLLVTVVQQAQAQTSTLVTVTSYNGTSRNYTLSELQSLPATSGYGGFYQPNQQIINNGLWTGVSVLYLCNQVHGLTQTSAITVIGLGVNNFTYSMVANGLGLNPTYKTYNNLTGNQQNQTLPVTLILAYQVNGTSLPSSSVPEPRLVIVGPEGLLMDGSGGRSVTKVTVTDTQIPEFLSWGPVVLFFMIAPVAIAVFKSKQLERKQPLSVNK